MIMRFQDEGLFGVVFLALLVFEVLKPFVFWEFRRKGSSNVLEKPEGSFGFKGV